MVSVQIALLCTKFYAIAFWYKCLASPIVDTQPYERFYVSTFLSPAGDHDVVRKSGKMPSREYGG